MPKPPVQLFTVFFEVGRLSEEKEILKNSLDISKRRYERRLLEFEYGQTNNLEVLNQLSLRNGYLAYVLRVGEENFFFIGHKSGRGSLTQINVHNSSENNGKKINNFFLDTDIFIKILNYFINIQVFLLILKLLFSNVINYTKL